MTGHVDRVRVRHCAGGYELSLILALRSADTRGRRFDGAGRGGNLREHDPWVQGLGLADTFTVVPPSARRITRRLRGKRGK